MYYKKSKENLDEELFKNPTSEYRGAPFWAWNTKLNQAELDEQIEIFKEMGFGGFFMHVRQGLEDDYLGNEFLSAIKNCTDKARSLGMYACLYDEDRWPSGCAGGLVTKNKAFRQRYLSMTFDDIKDDAPSKEEALREGKPYFLAAFDVDIDEAGIMLGYRRVPRNYDAKNKRYFFVNVRQGGEPRYNYQSYVDTMSKEAIDKFISLTYNSFKETAGYAFGSDIPFIFTDEPQVVQQVISESGFSNKETLYAWTMDFDETYETEYGESIIEKLPELFFTVKGDLAAKTRYNYYRHVSERFCTAYMDNIGKWCDENNIMMTGHVYGEDSLNDAVRSCCDVMRTYKNMRFPGIDMLYNDRCFTTAIQCRSVVRQYGREGMLSELYGVTGWDFDFRGHKFQGDWQSALGVTYRVPHLAWQTMKGEGKRDYPASIFYQSPWYEEYKIIEDHYARISTVLTRGTPSNRAAVIHPIESYWLLRGARAESKDRYEELEEHFNELSKWLIDACVDYDYIAESLLEDLCSNGDAPLQVGKMQYDTIIISDCITLRPYTINILNRFKENGGKLIVMGRTPYMTLGVPSESTRGLCENATVIAHSKAELYENILANNEIIIRNTDGTITDNLICTLRNDSDDKWVYIAHSDMPELSHISTRQDIVIEVRGKFDAKLYDTLSGQIFPMDYCTKSDRTKIFASIYDLDSLLIRLTRTETEYIVKHKNEDKTMDEIALNSEVEYSLPEENILVLDMAQYSVNGEPWSNREEILRIDSEVRTKSGLSLRRFKVVQPWVIKEVPENNILKLRYTFESEIECEDIYLALENSKKVQISFNGEEILSEVCGFYVDKYIDKIKLTKIRAGENVLELTMPFGLRTDIENCFILGNFGVECKGDYAYIIKAPHKLRFGSVVNQGFAFYGGNIEYNANIELDSDAELEFEISYYRGALIKVLVDDIEQGNIFVPPFRLRTNKISRGIHKLKFVLYGNRYNTFSALHTLLSDKKRVYIGPDYWRSENDGWAYEYQTRPMGILKKPIIKIIK